MIHRKRWLMEEEWGTSSCERARRQRGPRGLQRWCAL